MDYKEINAGKYDVKIKYPEKPKKSPILTKNAGNLTDEELASVPALKKEYDDALVAYKQQIDAYRAEQGQCENRFRLDAFKDVGMDPNSDMANALYSRAWDIGHSSGYYEVYIQLCELSDIYEIHQKELRKLSS